MFSFHILGDSARSSSLGSFSSINSVERAISQVLSVANQIHTLNHTHNTGKAVYIKNNNKKYEYIQKKMNAERDPPLLQTRQDKVDGKGNFCYQKKTDCYYFSKINFFLSLQGNGTIMPIYSHPHVERRG